MPSLPAPARINRSVVPEVTPSTTAVSDSSSSMRAAAASSAAAGRPSARPNSSCQRASTFCGRRQTIAEFTNVVPPTQRPCRIGVVARPKAACLPWSRKSRLRDAPSETPSVFGSSRGPSSSTTTRAPDAASTRAAAPPPAPEPTTTKSASSVGSPLAAPSTNAPLIGAPYSRYLPRQLRGRRQLVGADLAPASIRRRTRACKSRA